MLPSSQTLSSPFLPPSELVLGSDLPAFHVHQPPPPSPSLLLSSSRSFFVSVISSLPAHHPPLSFFPPAPRSSFLTCPAFNLSNLLLPLPPLQCVSPRL